MFSDDQASSLRRLRPVRQYPSVLVVGDTARRRHYWANGLKEGLEHLGQQAVIRFYDYPRIQSNKPVSGHALFHPLIWQSEEGEDNEVIELIEVSQTFDRLPPELIRSSLVVLIVSGRIAELKYVYAWIKQSFLHYGKRRFYLLGDAPTPTGGSVCEHLATVAHRFLPAVELRSLSHVCPSEPVSSVSFKLNSSMTLYVKVFRQLAFMLYDSVLFESAPSEMLNHMSKERYVSSRKHR
jgi:hypothetical protein